MTEIYCRYSLVHVNDLSIFCSISKLHSKVWEHVFEEKGLFHFAPGPKYYYPYGRFTVISHKVTKDLSLTFEFTCRPDYMRRGLSDGDFLISRFDSVPTCVLSTQIPGSLLSVLEGTCLVSFRINIV